MTTVTQSPPVITPDLSYFPVSLGTKITMEKVVFYKKSIKIEFVLTEDIKKCWKKYGESCRLSDHLGHYLRNNHTIYHIYKVKGGYWTFSPVGLTDVDKSKLLYFTTKYQTTRFISEYSQVYQKDMGWEHLHCFMNRFPECLPYDSYLGRHTY